MRSPVNRYAVFGRAVGSEFPLPLATTDVLPEIRISAGRVVLDANDRKLGEAAGHVVHLGESRAVLTTPRARFAVTANEVVIDAPDAAVLADEMCDSLIALALSARGIESLHGSVVARGDRAIAVAGDSGTGKSTAAGLLLELGGRLVTDDVIVLDPSGRVELGPPFIRAFPVSPQIGAVKQRLHPPMAPGPTRLAGLVVLDAAHSAVVPLYGTEAVHALMEHFSHELVVFPGQAARRLDLAARLAGTVALWGAPPRSLTLEQVRIIRDSAAPG